MTSPRWTKSRFASEPCAGRREGRGLSLLETLVVLALVSLLSALMLQGLGAFANRYDTVQRVHRTASFMALRQHWFTTSVRGLVPVGVEARRFLGAVDSFHGITLQPLAAESGLPVQARWYVDGTADQAVMYAEDDAEAWQVFASDGDRLTFAYADSKGAWHQRWPVASAPGEWLPHMIRLNAEGEGTVWLASIVASPQPAFDERVLRLQ